MREEGTELYTGFVELCEHLSALYGPSLVVYEIGSYAGESALIFSRYFSEVHCVDPWSPEGDTEGGPAKEAEFDARVAGKRIVKHKAYSAEFAPTLPDESIDFAYIDANHSYEHVLEDVSLWWPKVRLAIGGHDWNDGGEIAKAVREVLPGREIECFPDTSWLIRKASA